MTGGQTDLCAFVCVSPFSSLNLIVQMASQESWGCLQSCVLKREQNREQFVCAVGTAGSAQWTQQHGCYF